MKRKMVSILLCAAMLASVVSGCGDSGSTAETESSGTESTGTESSDGAAAAASGEEDNIIRIGAVCAMTGGSAIYGEGAQNAIDMEVEEINSAGGDYTVEIVNGGKVADDA